GGCQVTLPMQALRGAELAPCEPDQRAGLARLVMIPGAEGKRIVPASAPRGVFRQELVARRDRLGILGALAHGDGHACPPIALVVVQQMLTGARDERID